MNSGTMSSVAQPMCTFAGGVGVAHRHRVVDQHELDLEVLAVGVFQTLPALKPLLA